MRAGSLVTFLIVFVAGLGHSRDQHYTLWSDVPEKYLSAITEAKHQSLPQLPPGRARGGIVTHHFLASGLMVDFFESLRSRSSPKRIILLAPNHHHQGMKEVSVSLLPWKTPFGQLKVDQEMVARFQKGLQYSTDPLAFSGEHSVGVLLPFIHHYFPEAAVCPVLLRTEILPEQEEAVENIISSFLRAPDTVVILSMDFSHNSDVGIADRRDDVSRRAVLSLDAEKSQDLHVDSRVGLRILLSSLLTVGEMRPFLLAHTNSARITGRLDQKDVTSYFSFLFFEGHNE